MIITYIANTIFVLVILFVIYLIVVSYIYRDKSPKDNTGQSERQERNDDYNNDYFV